MSIYSTSMRLTTRLRKRLFIRLLLAISLLSSLPCYALNLVVNPHAPIEGISRNEARSIFSMRLREWSDGTPIVVFVLPDQTNQHRQFVQTILAMFPHQLRRQWDRYVYTGIGQAPIEVKNESEMIKRVQETPGAIGYINEEITDANIRKLSLH